MMGGPFLFLKNDQKMSRKDGLTPLHFFGNEKDELIPFYC